MWWYHQTCEPLTNVFVLPEGGLWCPAANDALTGDQRAASPHLIFMTCGLSLTPEQHNLQCQSYKLWSLWTTSSACTQCSVYRYICVATKLFHKNLSFQLTLVLNIAQPVHINNSFAFPMLEVVGLCKIYMTCGVRQHLIIVLSGSPGFYWKQYTSNMTHTDCPNFDQIYDLHGVDLSFSCQSCTNIPI